MSYVFPQLGAVYAALGPWVEALLRVAVGLLLVPHAMRTWLGMFPDPTNPASSLGGLVALLDRRGWHPGWLWAPIIIATEIVGGVCLALGLFTRIAAIPIVILLAASVIEHRSFGWFWNRMGIEYPILWFCAALYFLVHGGGLISFDRLIGWQF